LLQQGVYRGTHLTYLRDRIHGVGEGSWAIITERFLHRQAILARITHEGFYYSRYGNQNFLRYSFFAPRSYKWRSTSQAQGRRTWARWPDVQAGGLAVRSVNIYCVKFASLPRGLGPEACLAHSYKGASPLVESPRRGHPLRNSQSGCYPASRLRAPVSRDDCVILRRTVMIHAG